MISINKKTFKSLQDLGLLDCIHSYAELTKMVYIFENVYFSPNDMGDFILNYFSPRENIIEMLSLIEQRAYMPIWFLDLIKDQKASLTSRQYRALLECALLSPATIEEYHDIKNIMNFSALADAFDYAYNSWSEDLDIVLKSNKLVKKTPLVDLTENKIKPYVSLYYDCQINKMATLKSLLLYMQRFLNWIYDNARWVYNNPGKALTLLIVSIAITAVLEMFTPVLLLLGFVADKFSLTVPAWISAIGGVGSTISGRLAATRGLGWAAGMWRTHLFVHIVNNKISTVVKNAACNIDVKKVAAFVESVSNEIKNLSSVKEFKSIKF